MPEYDDFEDDSFGDEDFSESSNGDTAVMKQLRKQVKEQARQIKELTARNAEAEKANRERSIAEVLTSKGVNPKVAKLIPGDLEPTPENIDQWISDYADVFNIQVDTPPAEEPEEALQHAAFDRMRSVEDGGRSAVGANALQQKIASAGSKAELLALLERGGAA